MDLLLSFLTTLAWVVTAAGGFVLGGEALCAAVPWLRGPRAESLARAGITPDEHHGRMVTTTVRLTVALCWLFARYGWVTL